MAHTSVHDTKRAFPCCRQGFTNLSYQTASNHMIEMYRPLTLSRRKGLANMSICNRHLKRKVLGNKCCTTAVNEQHCPARDEYRSLASRDCKVGELVGLKLHQRDEWPKIDRAQDLGFHCTRKNSPSFATIPVTRFMVLQI